MSSSPKTLPTDASVAKFIAALDAPRRADCTAIAAMMEKAAGEAPRLWGSSIVGFGSYRSNTGEWPIVGFAPRKNDLTLYLKSSFDGKEALLARLGKHKSSVACLYIKRLSDVDTAVLRQLIEASVAAMASQRLPVKAA